LQKILIHLFRGQELVIFTKNKPLAMPAIFQLSGIYGYLSITYQAGEGATKG
jgi:hypothetical protein